VRDATRGNLATDASTVEEYLDRSLDHVAVSKTPTTVRLYRGKNVKVGAILQSSRSSETSRRRPGGTWLLRARIRS
jgi:hypothetical protein